MIKLNSRGISSAVRAVVSYTIGRWFEPSIPYQNRLIGVFIFVLNLAKPPHLNERRFLQIDYFLRETVKKPFRGFSFTIRSSGRSQGSPLSFFSFLAKK